MVSLYLSSLLILIQYHNHTLKNTSWFISENITKQIWRVREKKKIEKTVVNPICCNYFINEGNANSSVLVWNPMTVIGAFDEEWQAVRLLEISHVEFILIIGELKLFLEIKNIFAFFINSQHSNGTGSLNPSLWKTGICLSYIYNTRVVDGLETQGTRASAAMVFT